MAIQKSFSHVRTLRYSIDNAISRLPISFSRIKADFKRVGLICLGAFYFFCQMPLVLAQTSLPDEDVDSTKGYWRTNTQAATRSTRVQFFGPGNQLLYEEILPEKWVKLSARNQKQFDQLLAQLLSNQLLASRVKTKILPPTPAYEETRRATTFSGDALPPVPPMNSCLVHAYMNQSGKLYMIINNPDRLRYKIRVIDQRNRALYEEFSNLDQYRRKLDVSSLAPDAYKAIVQIGAQTFVYQVKQQSSKMTYSIRDQTATSRPDADSYNQKAVPSSVIPPDKIDL